MQRFTNIVKKHQAREQKLGNKLQEHVKLLHADLVEFVKAEVEEAKKMMNINDVPAPVLTVLDEDEDAGVPADAPIS